MVHEIMDETAELNPLLNREYHGIDRYLTEILRKNNVFVWEMLGGCRMQGGC